MRTSTVNISFRSDLLALIDQIAHSESRTRSELIREAARLYIEKKKKWEGIFHFGDRQVSNLGLKETDVAEEIEKHRQEKRK